MLRFLDGGAHEALRADRRELGGRHDDLPRVPEPEDREDPHEDPAISIATPAHRAIVQRSTSRRRSAAWPSATHP